MKLTAKTALVTGAANRLGAQIARTLHQNGANLIIHYRGSAAAAQSLTRDLNQLRDNSAICLQANLSVDVEIEELAQQAIAAFAGLDILVNNASSFYPTKIGTIDQQAWDDLTSTNFKAPLFLAQACYPALRKQYGCIVNMIDIYASRPLNLHSVYCAAKAANQMLVKSLALELAPEVRVNGIAPGAILWPQDDADYDHERQQALINNIPLKRRGTPQAIADSLLLLVANDYITGEIICVDGGRLLR